MAALGVLRSMAGSLVTRVLNNPLCYKTIHRQTRWYHITRNLLAERRYSKDHEWVSVENNIGTVGVSEHAQESLGDIVFVQLPDIGNEVEKDGECGVVESVKAASDLYSPVSGKITDVNEDLVEAPGLVNSSPYEKGWIFKLELADKGELESLMDEAAYKEFISDL